MTGGEVDIVDTFKHKCSQHANNPSHLTSIARSSAGCDSSMILREIFEYVELVGCVAEIQMTKKFIYSPAHSLDT